MSNIGVSPMTGSKSELIGKVQISDIVTAYKQQHQADVEPFLPGIKEILLYRCPDTDLEFFEPRDLTGPPKFYEALYAHADWGYQDEKWEFAIARGFIPTDSTALDIGCGGGNFLASIAKQATTRLGLETSAVGRGLASEKGVTAIDASIESYVNGAPAQFDTVTAFQVLEHVDNPLSFLKAARSTLRPGGRLILSTPNKDGFIRHCPLLPLDHPPHHVTRWGRKTFEALGALLSLRLEAVEKEPLQPKNIGWFKAVFEARYLPASRWKRSLFQRSGGSSAMSSFLEEQCQTIDGHTILAVYVN
jgi:SAM-dependent methyltransferase